MPFMLSVHKLLEPKRNMWKSIVAFFNTPIKRYGLDGEEIIDPSPRIPMIWSIPVILGGAVSISLLALLTFAFVIQ